MMIIKLRNFILLMLFLIISTEIFSFIGSKLRLFYFNNPPYIYSDSGYQNLESYWTKREKWGAWHRSNFEAKHKKECFDVVYKTNEIGARDYSFKKINNKKNILLIGDSFTEGYGLNKSDMFETIVEKKTHYNVLNFGTSKDFGILQYYLIHENLAKFYNHQALIIMLLPNNDFKDNDLIYYQENNLDSFNGSKRYRPYYIKNNDIFDIYYPDQYKKTTSDFEYAIKKYFWFSNVLRTINYFYINLRIKNQYFQTEENKNFLKNKNNTKIISAYYDTPLYQQEAGIFFLKKLISQNKKKIYLFSIPLTADYEAVKKKDHRDKIFWWKSLKKMEKDYKNFKFIDLIDYINDDYNTFFYHNKCDGHWNPAGNKWAGEVISNILKNSD